MWPSENPWPVTVLCVIIAVGLFVAWTQQKRGSLLIAMIIPLLIAAGAWCYDILIVTEREQVTMNVRDIVKAFQKQNLEETLSYVSDGSPALKGLVASAIHAVKLSPETRVSDIQVEMVPRAEHAITTFRVNTTVTAGGAQSFEPTMWEARWNPEKSGWKMAEIIPCDPITGKRRALPSEFQRYLDSPKSLLP